MDASYDSGDGSEVAIGRDAVLEKFQGSVNGLDRLMGQREVQLHNVSTTGDTEMVEWTARYVTAGLPALEIKGVEFARFDGDSIAQLRDEIGADSLALVGAWMEAHGSAL